MGALFCFGSNLTLLRYGLDPRFCSAFFRFQTRESSVSDLRSSLPLTSWGSFSYFSTVSLEALSSSRLDESLLCFSAKLLSLLTLMFGCTFLFGGLRSDDEASLFPKKGETVLASN